MTIVSVEVFVVGFGLKLTVAPAGPPLRLKVTALLNPFDGLMVTVYRTVEPFWTVCDAGDTDNEKSGVARPVSGLMHEDLTS